jgi:hypothetical protein
MHVMPLILLPSSENTASSKTSSSKLGVLIRKIWHPKKTPRRLFGPKFMTNRRETLLPICTGNLSRSASFTVSYNARISIRHLCSKEHAPLLIAAVSNQMAPGSRLRPMITTVPLEPKMA